MSSNEKWLFDQSRTIVQNEFGGKLLRNNSGACMDAKSGTQIRFGLGNDSAQLNAVYKTPDGVGVVPIVIQPHHVGRVFGVALHLEDKAHGWTYKASDKRAEAQMNHLSEFAAMGAITGFVTDPEHVRIYIRNFINGQK